MNLISRSLIHSTVTAAVLSVTPVGTLSAELVQSLTAAGFSPAQASFIDRCITWVENVRPEAAEADVWMLCANALIRLEKEDELKCRRSGPGGTRSGQTSEVRRFQPGHCVTQAIP